MKKLLLPAIFLMWLLRPAPVAPQSRANAIDHWAQTLGGWDVDTAKSVRQTSDDGYLLAGTTYSFDANTSDAWVLKLDATGQVDWEKRYGGADLDKVASAQQTGDGGYIVAGTTTSFGAQQKDIWVLKLDSAGNLQWQKRYGGTGDETAVGLLATTGSGALVAGNTTSFGAGQEDIWLLKLDAGGGVEWQRTYGGANIDVSSSLQQLSGGGYVLAGKTLSFGVPSGDFWLLRLDTGGNIAWQQTFGLRTFIPPNIWNDNIDYAPQVAVTPSDGIIVAGTSAPLPAGKVNAWVIRLDAAGTILWQKLFTTVADYEVSAVATTGDGGYILSGRTGSLLGTSTDGLVMKLDADGNVSWQKRIRGDNVLNQDWLADIQETADAGYITVGTTHSYDLGEGDMWVLKLDAAGEILDCPAIVSSTATITNTTEVGVSTAAVVLTTTAQVSDTTAVAAVTAAYKGDGCCLWAPDLVNLRQSGQTISAFPRDDGDLEPGIPWPSPRFIGNLNGTITDNLTGLTWLQDANCADTIGYDPNGAGNGRMIWTSALDFVVGINAGVHDITSCASYSAGHTDWRMANINEMETLVHAGAPDQALWLGGQGFANVQLDSYWSSTSHANGPHYAWVVEMDTGRKIYKTKASGLSYFTWPVRGGQHTDPDPNYPANVPRTGQKTSYYIGDNGNLQVGVAWPAHRFIDNQDGTVVDGLTGLMWLQDAACLGPLSWENGLLAVANFNLNPGSYSCYSYAAAYDDWRVPNRIELSSLVDHEQTIPDPPLAPDHPFVNLAGGWYWSSTSNTAADSAWGFDMAASGGMILLNKITYSSYIWPVRGGLDPAIAVRKTANVSAVQVGQTITYTYQVTNTGRTLLDPVIARDDRLGSVPLGLAALDPGQSTSGVLSYTVAVSDLPGPLTNTVTVTGTLPMGSAVTGITTHTVMLIDHEAVTISAIGGEVVLQWLHGGSSIDRYEVWRSDTPYFLPNTPAATKLADVDPLPAWQPGDPVTYTDTSSGLGDIGLNHFYLIRTLVGNTAVNSKLVSEFDFRINPGTMRSIPQ